MLSTGTHNVFMFSCAFIMCLNPLWQPDRLLVGLVLLFHVFLTLWSLLRVMLNALGCCFPFRLTTCISVYPLITGGFIPSLGARANFCCCFYKMMSSVFSPVKGFPAYGEALIYLCKCLFWDRNGFQPTPGEVLSCPYCHNIHVGREQFGR